MRNITFRLYYGWVIIAVSFLTLFLALGTRNSFGVFYIAILREYGWNRAETAGAFSLAMIVHGLFAPVTGIFMDRFGPRLLFPLGSMILFAGLVAASRIHAIWHLYLFFGVAIAIGVNTLSFSPHMSIIPRWFIKKRGLASGLALSGSGAGVLVLVPMNEYFIGTLGWRYAFLILGGFILFLLVPLTSIFHRRSPRDVGQYPDGMTPPFEGHLSSPIRESRREKSILENTHLWTFRAAIGTKSFWALFFVALSNGFVINLMIVHLAVYMVDLGYSQMLAASLVGLVGIMGSLGGIFCGFLSDRIGREMAFTLGSLLAFLGVTILLLTGHARSLWIPYIFAISYGLGMGATASPMAVITGDFFPGNALGRIMAIQSLGFGIGGALGPYLAGFFYDNMGSYVVPFLLLLFSLGIGILAVWTVAPLHRRSRMVTN